MGWDSFLDKVEVVVNWGNRVYGRVERFAEPAVKVVSPHVDTFAQEMDPIMNRPVDWVLFLYFSSHIPITIFFDLQPLYPQWIIPTFFQQLHGTYMALLNDPFMDKTIAVKWWFKSFSLCEAFLQLPFFFFATYGVFKDKSWVRLPLAVYCAHVMTTVVPCLTEIAFNKSFGLEDYQRNILLMLYSPYFFIPLIGLVDSYIRITNRLKSKDAALIEKKNE
ncbi:unnamed protein product [Mucor circinelloides]